MTVHFIGAGPGAPDLLTLRGRDLIAASPVCLYAGSLIPVAVLEHCPPGARVVNTAPLSLDQIMAEIAEAHAQGHDIARLHSGDLSVWSAMGEQLRRLRAMEIPFTVTPGVPSFAAAAAALESELTLPELGQSLILTRTPGRASSMPPGETLRNVEADEQQRHQHEHHTDRKQQLEQCKPATLSDASAHACIGNARPGNAPYRPGRQRVHMPPPDASPLIIATIGMNIATTIVPTSPPIATTMIGSSNETNDATATSTSSS